VIGRPLYFHGEFSEYLPDWHPWEDYRSFYMAKKSLGGGSILDQSHIIDLAHYILGEIKEVYCINDRFSDLQVDADDMAEMMVRFKSGVPGTIHSDMFGRNHKKFLEIKGTEGNIFWNFYDYSVEVYHAKDKRTEKWSFKKDANEMYTYETKHFIECVKNNKKPKVALADGIHTMKVILAAEKSSRTRKNVCIG
ncbi:MAG: Gfo/Idh/MocA family oxidoreductase, partial [Candidatus Omnitrophica bacterium]|nr:Gfo/Idh/MocA family oxidoreductase [Candidatus Omnitrophota bacterium]